MIYHNFGRTGVKVSVLCLGAMNFGTRTKEDNAIEIINMALEKGINFIDTANVYGFYRGEGERVGYSEEIIGKTLQQNGMRERIVLATKVFFEMDPDDPNAKGLS